jgi:hypothetical protein
VATTGDPARSVVESTSGFMLRRMAAATAVEMDLLAQRSASNDDEQLANDRAVYQTRTRHEQLRKGRDAAVGFDAPEEHLQVSRRACHRNRTPSAQAARSSLSAMPAEAHSAMVRATCAAGPARAETRASACAGDVTTLPWHSPSRVLSRLEQHVSYKALSACQRVAVTCWRRG